MEKIDDDDNLMMLKWDLNVL